MSREQHNVLTEHEFESMPGVPAALPEGEYLRWQGRPRWRDLAVSALHVRKLAVYFAVLLAIRIAYEVQIGATVGAAVAGSIGLVVLAALALCLLLLLSWLMARAACYTITSERVLIRCGVALSFTVNLPFARIVSVDLRRRCGGFGDISLKLDRQSRPSWVILWPHVRAWTLGGLRPTLRSLPDAERAAAVLGEALRARARAAGAVEVPIRVDAERPPVRGEPSPSAG